MEAKMMNELFTAAQPALLTLPPESLLRPRVPRERAVQLTTILRGEFEPLVPRLDDELSPARAAARKANFASLETHALVFYAADLAVETPWTSEQKARRAELVKKVHQHDDMLASWAQPLFKNDEKLRPVLEDIARGRGVRDDADDTVRWVALFRQEWAKVESKTAITQAQLDEAETDATELLRMLDAQDGKATGSPRDLRQRAYTRWHATYSEIFHLGRYLLRHDPAAAERLPAIAAERGEAAAPMKGETPAPVPPPPAVTPVTPA